MRKIADEPHTWPVVGSREIHRDNWVVALREDTVQRPDHPDETFGRLVLEHPGAVIVLAVDDEARVRCLWQYRHAAHRLFVELPAGLIDAGDESRMATGMRVRVRWSDARKGHITDIACFEPEGS